jgi:uncharacterized protein (DUF1501 family)
MALTRREFLLRSFGALGAATLAMEGFGMTDAFAQAADYKALVCVFLFGGNDSDNILIPYDNYSQYAVKRNNSANVGIPQASLLQITPSSGLGGAKFGLHPALDGIKSLWDLGKVAIMPNTGPLVEPLTRNEYRNRLKRIPLNLFSHSDQENQWQTAVANGFISTGWGGRTADAIASLNGSATFPMIATMAGNNIFSTGAFRRPLALSPAPASLSRVIRLDGFPNPPASLQGIPRYDAMEAIQALDGGFTVVKAANEINLSTFATMEALRSATDPVVSPFPLSPRTGLGNQLEQVAKVISLRDTLALKRQIFFCSIGGFDTHGDQVNGNDAPSTVSRLLNMGIEPFLVTASVNLIMAQRLARRICAECREEVPKEEHALLEMGMKREDIARVKTFRGRGCKGCSNTGYRGRIALYEVMDLKEELKEFVLNGASALELKREAIRLGMQTLRQSALRKLAEGTTTISEVVRVSAADH